MAVAHVATGTRVTSGTTTAALAYPSGVAAGRLAVAHRAIKPSTATGTAEAGWTQQQSVTGGTGTQGIDAGPSRITVDTLELAGSESGSVTFDQGSSPNSVTGAIGIYSVAAGKVFDLASTTGNDSTHGTGRAATGSAISLAPGDVVIALCASCTDDATAFTSPAITASGITFGTTTERLGAGGAGTGQDVGSMIYEATVTAGTGTVAPTLSLSGGPSNCGPVAFLRLREANPPANPIHQGHTLVPGFTSDTSIAFTEPAGFGANDICVVKLYLNTAKTVTPPSGAWSQPTNGNATIPTAGYQQQIWWKRGDVGGSYTFSWTGATGRGGSCHRISGCVSSGDPWDGTPDHQTTSTASTNSPTVETTTTVADTLLLHFRSGSGGSATWGPSAGYAEVYESQDFTADWIVQAAAGASGSVVGTHGISDRQAAFLGALKPPAAGQTEPVGQAQETDTATQLTRQKVRTLGLATSTETATAITRKKVRVLGQAVEADSATSLTRQHARAVGQASEADTATHVATGPVRVNLGQAAETDTATSLTKRKVRATGQALEADTATQLTRQHARPVGQAAEVDTATAATKRKQRTTGQAAEVDTATALTRQHRRGVGQALEADTATQLTRRKTKTTGQAAEVDTATQLTRRKARPVGQAAEVDTAGSLGTPGAPKIIGQATETDTATALTRRKQRSTGQALEADTATALTRRKSRPVGQATEADTATALARRKSRSIGQATETDTATALARRKQRLAGQATETDTASAITGPGLVRIIGQATEIDLAFAIEAVNALALVLVAEAAVSAVEASGGSGTPAGAVTGRSGATDGASGHGTIGGDVTGATSVGGSG